MNVSLSFAEGELTPNELAEALDTLPAALENQLKQAATDIWSTIEAEAKDNAPVDTGALRASIRSTVEEVGATILHIRIGSSQEYAAAQEFGTDPFFPPPSALREWARSVLGDADAAYPVARSISESGLEAQPYLRPAFRDNIRFIVDRINDAVDSAFAEVGLA